MSALYLAKDSERTVWLAVEQDGKLYGYVPNVEAFVYNEPMTLDFLIDRELSYDPITAEAAADVIHTGVIGRIDGRTNKYLLGVVAAETRRLMPADVLGANAIRAADLRAGIDPTPTETARAKAEILRTTPVGTWLVYKTYLPSAARQTALQLASDLRKGRVKAFAGIQVQSRVLSSEQGHHIVQIARETAKPATQTPPRRTKTKAKRTKAPKTTET